ncbi:hypothetical protein, partial [Ligilactobacillus ruminis]|uniref:hypothetical protein n=1 Tax=Ligilactobacillus ruminis TaxID=1623 RepID=UPI003F9CF043
FILLVFLVFLVNLNYTWEMSTWLSFFINLHHYTGITPAHPEFAPSSRQKAHIHPVFCLLLVPHGPIQTYGRDSAKARDFETMFDANGSAF